jgi:hypothetical protein
VSRKSIVEVLGYTRGPQRILKDVAKRVEYLASVSDAD